MTSAHGDPAISVIVVRDHLATDDGSDFKRVVAALAQQTFPDPFEVLLVESRAHQNLLAVESSNGHPRVRTVTSEARGSFALKNEGVRAARADLIALLDSDCTPEPNWLRAGVTALRGDARRTAVSGHTGYAATNLRDRLLALLSRSYLDPGRPGHTRFLSNNNAILRRVTALQFPLPEAEGPFSARLMAQKIRRDGGELWFEPAMRVTHQFQGWPMERDIRRHLGRATIRIRQLDRTLPGSSLLRLGVAAIPVFVLARIVESWWHCVRAGHHHGVRWFELPAAFVLALVVHALEISGMVDAFIGRPIGQTSYR